MSENNPSSLTASGSVISTSQRTDRLRLLRRKWIWGVAGIVVILVFTVVLLVSVDPGGNPSLGPTAQVRRGPFVVKVTEAGEVEAEKRTVISNELDWPVVIEDVIPEGTLVKKGDTIIEFECRELMESMDKQEIIVTSARNDYTQARENLKLKRKETANKVRKAQQDVKDAEEDRIRYVESEWPIKHSEKVSQIDMIKSELKLAESKLAFKKDLNKRPGLQSPYSKSEIESEELKVKELQNRLKKTTDEMEMLEKYDDPRERRALEFAVEDAKLDLERAELEANTQVLMGEATEQAKKATLKMQEERLEEQLEDKGKLIVKAEKEGLVVYDTGGSRRRPSDVTVERGARINPRQQLMIIPDMSTLQIKTKVYEAIYEHVREGVEAYVRFDAKPDRVLKGKVKKMSVLPDRQDWWRPGVRIFNVNVTLDEQIEGLIPGMTAEVELILARLDDVLSVPIAGVFTEQDETFCYVASGEKVTRRKVKVGLPNDECVEIISGLKVGESVLLQSPPSDQVSGTGGPVLPKQEGGVE